MAVHSPIPSMLPAGPRKNALASSKFLSNDPGRTTASKKYTTTPPTTDRVDRTSFSSIKENNAGVAQSFTDSKTSSYLRREFDFLESEDAIDDANSLSSGSATPALTTRTEGEMMMLNPQSALHGLVCPCDSFRGWKSISIRGKIASKSFGDLRRLGKFDWEAREETGKKMDFDGKRDEPRAGQSPLEKLPMELLGSIIDQLATDIPPNGFTARNIDLMSLLLTSRSIHSATLSTLYSQITIPHSRIFRKFLSHIAVHPSLGTIVRRLDFSHYNPTGAGMSRRERLETQNLIPQTLLECLTLTPNLREFLVQEHIDDELSSDVLKHLLCNLPKLKAVDFCACSSAAFKNAWTEVLKDGGKNLPSGLPIERLGFHECASLPSSTFDILLPLLPKLTHLDLAHTRVTTSALSSIPHTARLTHLNLAKCSHLKASDLIAFLATHPAAQTLVYLNLGMDAKSHQLFEEDDITALLPILPHSLRSLHLNGAKMSASHIPLLLPLTKHLEELALGRNLTLPSLTRLFVPNASLTLEDQLSWTPHQLRYLDVSDLSVSELDLGTLFGSGCPILKGVTSPLEVVEVGGEVNKRLEVSRKTVERVGWCVKEAGKRYWLVRNEKGDGKKDGDGEGRDSGARGWKWGASFWGMRKVPVARAEVGGMYGHYMFKR